MRRRPTESLETVQPPWEAGVATGSSGGSLDDLLESKAAVERMRQALVQLDHKDREAIVLRDLEEVTAERAAEMLGISTQAVRQRAHRGRLRLGRLLSEGFLSQRRPTLGQAGASVGA
jgi:RNA polymerase sigma factor (sigma-70 family)